MVYNFVIEGERFSLVVSVRGDRLMSQLVQSACPGCKNVLRIPTEWLHRPMRCKHCGMVMQAKSSAVSARSASIPSGKQTPLPASRKGQAMAVPVAEPVVPSEGVTSAALPAVPVAPAVNSSPFTDLTIAQQTSAPRTRRRGSRSGGSGKGPLLALAVFLITAFIIGGFIAYRNLDRLTALFPVDDDADARKNQGSHEGSEPPLEAQTTPSNKETPWKDPSKVPPRPGSNLFPRRALVISVHDYLYANPIQNGMPDSGAHNLNNLLNGLSLGLHIPLNQIAHLSDVASAKYGARAPTKTVIEQTLTKFLDTSRPQDRIMVFFVGHSVELEDKVYLAPIEGELDRAGTLIPLKWCYEQMAKCKARQKVLVLDVNRFNRTFGQERPGGEEMGPKLDAMLKAPPAGVQVWSSCCIKERSYATDDFPMGIFLDSFLTALQKGGNGRIQKVEDAIPIERYVDIVNKLMKNDLSKRKLEQVSRLTGKEADTGTAYDLKKPPPDAVTCLAPPPRGVEMNKILVESVLDQIGTPPIKVTHEMALRYDALPPFPVEGLKKYEGGESQPGSPLRKTVKNARAVLWAVYPGEEPKDLSGDVSQLRARIRVQLNVLKEGYLAPVGGGNAENQFKSRVENDERKVALMIRAIEDALEELQAKPVTEAREIESKRWKANYDFVLARMQLEHAYLFEYQSMLGSMRKEFPPRDAELHNGWRLASTARLQGDSTGKKAYKAALKLLDTIIKENAGSPWEVLAKREKLTNLGLEWQPSSRIQ
jgi:hypothetical protein